MAARGQRSKAFPLSVHRRRTRLAGRLGRMGRNAAIASAHSQARMRAHWLANIAGMIFRHLGKRENLRLPIAERIQLNSP